MPWILVKSEQEVLEIQEWINNLPEYTGTNGMMREYRRQLPNAPVLAFDTVEASVADGNQSWERLDTLPYLEVNPSSSGNLTKLGWNITSSA